MSFKPGEFNGGRDGGCDPVQPPDFDADAPLIGIEGQDDPAAHMDADEVPTDGIGVDERLGMDEAEEVTAEITESPAQTVHAQCLEVVDTAIAELRASIDAGDKKVHGKDDLAPILLDKANASAAAGDAAAVEATIETIDAIGTEKSYLGAAYGAAIKMGNEQAFETVRAELDAEKLGIEAALKTDEEAVVTLATLATPVLRGVISTCPADAPPDAWIEKFGANAEHKWTLHAEYRAKAVKAGGPEAATHQEAYDAKVGELITEDKFPPWFVFDSADAVLRNTQDPTLRAATVESFKHAAKNTTVTTWTFDTLARVGNTVINDPQLTTADNVEYFQRTIEFCAKALEDAGAPPEQIGRQQLDWQVSLRARYGATPAQMVEEVDLRVGVLLSKAKPQAADDVTSIMYTPSAMAGARESQLDRLAQGYAARGDFAGAKVCLDSMNASEAHARTLEGVLKHATTASQVAGVKPDDMAFMVAPELSGVVNFAEKKVADDVAGMQQVTVETAQAVQGDTDLEALTRIERMYTEVVAASPATAAPLARDLLAVMRANGVPCYRREYLSKALIGAGDQAEIQRAYDDIRATGGTLTQQAAQLWDLAKLLQQQL